MIRNYVIFNGKSSDEIEGLVIEELPNITRPKKRIDYVVIDGKDGDIPEEQGYSSYTKELQIGLKPNVDIDEVMNYFDGGGTAIFSNEPNKIYNVIADDKVDYKRLVTFKKATVKFHVQPYKYLVDEAPFVLNITNQTELKVSNVGYLTSKPIITLYGSGTVEMKINGVTIFNINIDDEYVVVDSLQEEAYKNNILKNRQMTGRFPTLKSGINTIEWVGNLTKIKIEPKSRWL